MSTITNGEGRRNASADDCARLWTTLTTEYIPGLRLEITPRTNPAGQSFIQIEVLDDSLETIDGEALVNVWSCREYQNGLNLISVGSLFDLLIVAYRNIEAFFEYGTPSAPTRRRK